MSVVRLSVSSGLLLMSSVLMRSMQVVSSGIDEDSDNDER